ncbi:MAG: glycosyltransferase [Acetobacterium sp.]|uniref:glycosyltransferase n=1 Tax=Acetobacterium sp. TaxID=1872094 RepID=UPI0032428CE2
MKISILTLGTRGDVQPFVALAQKALEKGHQAVICTGKTFKPFIEEAGIEFKEAASDLMAMLETEEGQMVFKHALQHPFRTKKYLDEVVNPVFRQTLDQFYEAALGADVILYHPKAFGAPDIAEALDIPCISIPPVPITFPIDEFPNLAISPTKNLGKRLNLWTYSVIAQAERSSINEVNDFREKTLHLPKRKSGLYTFSLNGQVIPIIYPISKALFPEVTSWEGRVLTPGFFYLDSQAEHLDSTLTAFLNSGPAPIIISFSSMPLKAPEQFKNCLQEALHATHQRGILLSGNSGFRFDEDENLLTIAAAPHSLLFPHGKGIVHHGGVGTMAAAIKSGKPQLIIPFSVDQPFWANRLYQQGYALKPLKEPQVTTRALIQRFIQFDEETVQSKAHELKAMIDQENGTETALAFIETHCRSKVKDHR